MPTKSTLGIAVAGAGLCFLGYCIYFDRQRRSDPAFKQKLRERRRKVKTTARCRTTTKTKIPDLKDTDSMQNFFLQEIQTGEELLAAGEIEPGVEHLCNAVAVCGQAEQLLQVLQQTLPSQVFQMMLQRLPLASQRIAQSAAGDGVMMADDDLE